MNESTPRRGYRSGSVDSTLLRKPTILQQRFPNTEKWNNIINIFVTKCPRGRHRRQFTYVDNSFTGKEAVDFMMDAIPESVLQGRKVSRENCTKLLQKILEEKKHFYRYGSHEGKQPIFKDGSWLYCFYSVPANPKSQTPKLMRRNSFTTAIQRIEINSPEFNGSIPSSPEKEIAFDRRRSMSYSNLADITQYERPVKKYERRSREPIKVSFNETPNCDRTRDNKDENEGLYGSFKKTKIFDKIRRRASPSPAVAPEPQLISHAPIITIPVCMPLTKPPAPLALHEIDMWTVFKSCLLKRTKEMMEENESIINWHINGNDIKWNCEKIGTDGLVIPRTKSDKYSDYVLRLINYLTMFPFPIENVNAVKYDEYQETKVFNVLCSNLEKASPLLTEEEATAILNAMDYFNKISSRSRVTRKRRPPPPYSPPRTRSNMNVHSSSSVSDTSSSFSSTPMTTVNVRRGAPLSSRSSSSYRSSFASTSTPSTYKDYPKAIRTNEIDDQIVFSAVSSRSGSLASSLDTCMTPMHNKLADTFDRISLEEVRSLKGLKMTPELEEKIQSYFSSCDSDGRTQNELSYTTARSSFSPFGIQMEAIEFELLRTTISLILLTLPIGRRWKLQTLLRMMNKVSVDENLRLDPVQTNREIVLEKLSKSIVPCHGSLTSRQAIDICYILSSGNVNNLFEIDEELLRSINETTADIQRQRAMTTGSVELNKAPTPPKNVIQYCQLASKTIYQDQNTHSSQFLLPLLDGIINDEKMKPAEKEKRLKQFRIAHPEVFAKRYPLGEVQLNGDNKRNFFKRVFGK